MENMKSIFKGAANTLIQKLLLSTVGVVILVVGLIVVIISAIISNGAEDLGSGPIVDGQGKQLPESVLIWKEDVAAEMERQELDQKYLYVLLAIMKQESNGDVAYSNGDIFKSSESKCGQIGCITDPIESIQQGVTHFKNNVVNAKDNMEVAIASYNFGNGFAKWTQENYDNKWSLDIAIEYSQLMMTKVNDPQNYSCIRKEAKEYGACYGDILYVPSILAYLPNNKGDIAAELVGDFAMPVSPMIITSGFGYRSAASTNGIGTTNHEGIDFACTNGVTKIRAVKEGTVAFSGVATGFGYTVVIQHDEKFYSTYGHMSSLIAEQGSKVEQGEAIGICGSTGNSTGPHLHLEFNTQMWGGRFNPQPYFSNL